MAKIDELESQVEEAKKRLAEMEDELQSAKDGEETVMADQEQDAPREEEVPDAPQEQSFADRVDERMSPAEEVMEEDVTPQMDEAMASESDPAEEPKSLDFDTLYSLVYDEAYDASDPKAEGRMRMMKEAVNDPEVREMAENEPEKFALFMYGKTSSVA